MVLVLLFVQKMDITNQELCYATSRKCSMHVFNNPRSTVDTRIRISFQECWNKIDPFSCIINLIFFTKKVFVILYYQSFPHKSTLVFVSPIVGWMGHGMHSRREWLTSVRMEQISICNPHTVGFNIKIWYK